MTLAKFPPKWCHIKWLLRFHKLWRYFGCWWWQLPTDLFVNKLPGPLRSRELYNDKMYYIVHNIHVVHNIILTSIFCGLHYDKLMLWYKQSQQKKIMANKNLLFGIRSLLKNDGGNELPIYQGTLLLTRFNCNLAWLSNHMPSKVWEFLIHSQTSTVQPLQVRECISCVLPHVIMDVLTYPCWD